ncbi:MAG TPA: BTAD domain-containing putative transcriptional regulator [Candidatus Cybelea sp.]|jgi:DNA-binding SARP family transcriptional activator|nr:BTAD domain-containing putative transcriptional regulator [Candidatus Cybelea sp.]
MDRGVTITAFRRFSVVENGEDRSDRFSPRARRLLAHLALRLEPVHRAALAAELWPDLADCSALANLRRRLHELESALQSVGLSGAIERSRDRVALAPLARSAIDVTRYLSLAADAARAGHAVALYDEPVFPGVDDETLERERRRMHALQLELLARLLERALGRGERGAIARLGHALVRLDPLSEATIHRAVETLRELGDADAARRLYDHFTAAMRAEVDAEPDSGVPEPDSGVPEPSAPGTVEERSRARERRMRHVLAPIVERGALLRGPAAGEHFDAIEAQMDEIRSALVSAIEERLDVLLGAQALAALSRFFFDRGYAPQAIDWYRDVVAALTPRSPLRAELLYLSAVLGRNLGNAEHNLPAFDLAIEELRAAGGDSATLAKAQLYASNAARMTGRVELASRLASEALTSLLSLNDEYLVAFARSAVGAAEYARGDLTAAREEFRRAAQGFARLEAGDDETLMLVDVARCDLALGLLNRAEANLRTAAARANAGGNLYVEGHAQTGLTLIALDRGDEPRARTHAARASEIALGCSDMELAVIAVEAAGELFASLSEWLRARDALAAADGVRSEYLIARSPTEHVRCERLRATLTSRSLAIESPVGAPEVLLRSLLGSVARSYGAAYTL